MWYKDWYSAKVEDRAEGYRRPARRRMLGSTEDAAELRIRYKEVVEQSMPEEETATGWHEICEITHTAALEALGK